MALLELLEKLFPADLPKDVQRRAMEYARKHPEMSDAEVAERYAPSMARAKKAETEKVSKQAHRQAAAKRKMTQMAYGGMAGGKKHMYAAGGSVTENPGLKALKKASPEAYNKITGK
jgi:hypothetical protein